MRGIASMPWDYATKQAVDIQGEWPNWKTLKCKQRVRDLNALVPNLAHHIKDEPSPEDVRALIRGLEAAERSEARRGSPIMQWTYDLIRHTQLRRHLHWERQLLARLGARETA